MKQVSYELVQRAKIFLRLTHQRAVCVGGIRVNDTWHWIDGHKWEFAPWDNKYPRKEKEYNCLQFAGDGKFRNIKCDHEEMGFICNTH